MREVKFRGKTAYGNWVIGSLIINNFENYFIESYNKTGIRNTVLVIPETVGQFTGLLDRKGKEIYEGDIMADYSGRRLLCEWFRGGFWLNGGQRGANYNIHLRYGDLEAIGNIHDNPELLKTE